MHKALNIKHKTKKLSDNNKSCFICVLIPDHHPIKNSHDGLQHDASHGELCLSNLLNHLLP